MHHNSEVTRKTRGFLRVSCPCIRRSVEVGSKPIQSASSISTSPRCRQRKASSISSSPSIGPASSPLSAGQERKPCDRLGFPSALLRRFPTISTPSSPTTASNSRFAAPLRRRTNRPIRLPTCSRCAAGKRHRASLHQNQPSLDERQVERMNRTIKEATVHAITTTAISSSTHISTTSSPPKFRPTAEDPQRSHAIRIRLQNLDTRTTTVHPQSDPSNAGTEHLASSPAASGRRSTSWMG